MQLVRKRLGYIFSKCEFKLEDNGKSFQEILLDVAKYEDDDVVETALHLLIRIYSDEAALFSNAAHSQLLCTKQSLDAYKLVDENLTLLRCHLRLGIESSEKAVQILDHFTDLCVWENDEHEPNHRNQSILYNFGGYWCVTTMHVSKFGRNCQCSTYV